MAFDITPYINMKPSEVRQIIREGKIDFPTAGMCAGYAQANLVILPPEYAADFEEYTKLNPFPCPVLEIIKGTPETHDMGEGANICTDIPRYRIYENGVFTKEITDASEYWKEGYVGFLIGCSFSFEEALIREGIDVRHITQGRNVPMFKTNIQTKKAGPFFGPMVCSMRPMTPENAQKAYDITVKMPNVHGAPVHMGDPKEVGVEDQTGLRRCRRYLSGRDHRILALRRYPAGSGGECEAADRYHPRSGPHVYHRHPEYGTE